MKTKIDIDGDYSPASVHEKQFCELCDRCDMGCVNSNTMEEA